MYLLGYDIGSSSIKAALVNCKTKETVAVVQSPKSEMEIHAPQHGWAEQDPETWWDNICLATRSLLEKTAVDPADIKGIGISYQMHGLVLVDKYKRPLRPAIIWCDSRAVEIGSRAFQEIGEKKCLSHLLNSPGNFTASKLKWVEENEPAVYGMAHKMMLPGDFIAMKLTDEISTTPSGLSEAMLWDFQENKPADLVLDYFEIEKNLLPEINPTCSIQGYLSQAAAEATGLAKGIPVAYRTGDQPNNALSLNVLEPGEVAATGGTSGVVYGVVDRPVFDSNSRVNGFAHVNHSAETTRIGMLLCINGAGSQYAWVKHQLGQTGVSYAEMEKLAEVIPIGCDRLHILPFGNGAERMLGNINVGAKINNLHFNRHSKAHIYRAALEGIAFSFVYGMGILKNMGLNVQVMRAGNDNLFQSKIFSSTISNLMQSRIELIETTGAVGAAKAAGVATGIYSSLSEAMEGNDLVMVYEPQQRESAYDDAYGMWEKELEKEISK